MELPDIGLIEADRAVKLILAVAHRFQGKVIITPNGIQFMSNDALVGAHTKTDAKDVKRTLAVEFSPLKNIPTDFWRSLKRIQVNNSTGEVNFVGKKGTVKAEGKDAKPYDFSNVPVRSDLAEIIIQDHGGPLSALGTMDFSDFDECMLVNFSNGVLGAYGEAETGEFQETTLTKSVPLVAPLPSKTIDTLAKLFWAYGAKALYISPVGTEAEVKRGIVPAVQVHVYMSDNNDAFVLIGGGECPTEYKGEIEREEERKKEQAEAERMREEVLPVVKEKVAQLERAIDSYLASKGPDYKKLREILGVKPEYYLGQIRRKAGEELREMEEDLNRLYPVMGLINERYEELQKLLKFLPLFKDGKFTENLIREMAKVWPKAVEEAPGGNTPYVAWKMATGGFINIPDYALERLGKEVEAVLREKPPEAQPPKLSPADLEEIKELKESYERHGPAQFNFAKARTLLEKLGRLQLVKDAYVVAESIFPELKTEYQPVGKKILIEIILKALEPNATKEDIYNTAKALAKEAKSEAEKERRLRSGADLIGGGLIRIVLYQEGKYPAEMLNKWLNEFFKQAEKYICNAVRPNGGVCYADYVKDYGEAGADENLKSDIKNFEMQGGWGKQIADLLRLSREVYYAPKLPLKDKILLFDRVVHAEHLSGSIFGDVDVPMAKKVADKELEELDKKLPALLRMASSYPTLEEFAKALGAWPDAPLYEVRNRLIAKKKELGDFLIDAKDKKKIENEIKHVMGLINLLPESCLTLREVWEMAHTGKAKAQPRKPQPTTEAEEMSPEEMCISNTETVLWNLYEAEFKLKELEPKEKPAWLRELAEKVCREEMKMKDAIVETLKWAKVDVANELYRKVIGGKPTEVEMPEVTPAKEKKPAEKEEATPEIPDIEDELRGDIERFIKKSLGVKPDGFIKALPITELAHAVKEGRLDFEDARDILRRAVSEAKAPAVLARIDWAKVLGKRGKIDPFKAEEKLMEQIQKAERELAERVTKYVPPAKAVSERGYAGHLRATRELPTFTYRNVEIPLEVILSNWELILSKGLRFALHDVTAGWLPKKAENEFIKWWRQLLINVVRSKGLEDRLIPWLLSKSGWALEIWRNVFTFGLASSETQDYLSWLYHRMESVIHGVAPTLREEEFVGRMNNYIKSKLPMVVLS